jgi:hypothetical protein
MLKLRAVVSVLFLVAVTPLGSLSQSYNAIFSFGDSISDTGNLCTSGCPSWLTTGQPPYGNTFFRRPTGRCSDGRLVIDFLGCDVLLYVAGMLEMRAVSH